MRPIVEIIRLEENHNYGTFGVLKINKEVFCVTLEPSDRENEQNVSSIPPQQYICERVQSPKFGETFQVKNVPGRSHILFHAGNVKDQTAGCILLGEHFGKLKGSRAVLNSGLTFHNFLAMMQNQVKFHLTIKEEY